MKRIAFILALVLVAGLASSQAKPFIFDAGAGLGYLAYSHDEQTETSGDLATLQGTYGFWGGNVFADISEYVTVYSGIWVGLGKLHATAEGPFPSVDTTYANSLLELEVGAVFKYPLHVGPSFTFAPKVGLSDMFYLSGKAGTSAPDSSSTYATSPFSVVTGFDADYMFPNGVFLRLPVDFGWGLNSRPKSEVGSYVSSNSVSFRTGISVGYRLSGMSADNAPPPVATAATPKPAETPAAKPEEAAEPAPDAAANPLPIRVAFGAGVSYLAYANTQAFSASSIDYTSTASFPTWGGEIFVDISDYFTAYFGYHFAAGDEGVRFTGLGSPAASTNSNEVTDYEFGFEAKYPFAVTNAFTVAAKVGYQMLVYAGGTLGGAEPSSSDDKLLVSPSSITLGVDLNYSFDSHWFVRAPLGFGIGLNSKFSSAYYTNNGITYSSSSVLSFQGGVGVGYKL